jgi:ComF family protein
MTNGKDAIQDCAHDLQEKDKKKIPWLVKYIIAPTKCIFCGELNETSVCRVCEDKLPIRQGIVKRSGFFSRCTAPFVYTGTVKKYLLKMKNKGRLAVAPAVAPYIAAAVMADLGEFDIVSFVPSDLIRLRKRGYNPAEALAKKTAGYFGVKCVRTLIKIRKTEKQSTLNVPAKREANVMGAFKVVGKVKGKRILLVDDVITTGATLNECAKMLRLYGARQVFDVTATAAEPPQKKEEE